jgi:CheY-like chemotaxis protein
MEGKRPMKKTILVVDDSKLASYTVKDGLEELDPDMTVITVESGIKCFEFLQQNNTPDIILLDIMMPEMNGWEVFKLLRKNQQWKNIPVIFITAKTDNFSKGFGKLIAEAYVEKPFEIKDLKQRIEKILELPFELSETKKKIIDDMIEHIPTTK